ncbi:LutC/YkgG family protein [Zhihengliuella flava]|uniref:L-lactate dehydrogenase complex protein LldG n=1 Tax=Zhihengliuella flava TaxID=1285193 RepID=A0A931DCN3_9MICC|nr:LUD domain-containing protein [Zhihengliuella flava]MBG6085096.1 L-lactate dehydrogenase complex protein LldG [Zhihengliuella flava]
MSAPEKSQGAVSAREEIFGRIRSALADAPPVPDVPREYRRTSTLGPDELMDLLTDRLIDYKARVDVVPSAEVPATVAARLSAAASCVVPDGLDDAWLADLGDGVRCYRDSREAPLSVEELDAIDAVVTSSAVSVAESGTIILDGSRAQGRRAISLVPDHHVCVVPASTIVQLLPEALPRLDVTSPQTWISGPSATSDIELERVEGVHGPRVLDVVIVTDA